MPKNTKSKKIININTSGNRIEYKFRYGIPVKNKNIRYSVYKNVRQL